MQLESLLENSATRFPDKAALVCGTERHSYRFLEEQSNRLAHALLELGVERGDRLAIYLDNTVEAVLTIFAALKVGAVFVVISRGTKEKKLRYVLNDCGARVLVTDDRAAPLLETGLVGNEAPRLEHVVLAGAGAGGVQASGGRAVGLEQILASSRRAEPPDKRGADLDLAALIYTSGSTGKPKGVMLTHLNMVSATSSINKYLENGPDDIILDVLPLSFDYGLYQIFLGFQVGGTVVLERSFAYPYSVAELASRERVTAIPMVPTISALLLRLDLKRLDLSSLRYVTNTGAALPISHIEKLRGLFPDVKIYSMYGLTECKRVSYLPPDQIDRRPRSVGVPMPNVEVAVLNEEGEPVGPGVAGELVVRGPNVMEGYWRLPEETEKVLRIDSVTGDRVLHTGDLFTRDEEGYLYFVARTDDIIKTRGQKVSPREVEEVILDLEGVLEVSACGVRDETLGQVIKAFVVVEPGRKLKREGILDHCRRNLEDFMVPGTIEICDSLPKTDSGKIEKARLKVNEQ